MALTNAEKQRTYRHRRTRRHRKPLLVSRFKAAMVYFHAERIEKLLTKWEEERRPILQ